MLWLVLAVLVDVAVLAAATWYWKLTQTRQDPEQIATALGRGSPESLQRALKRLDEESDAHQLLQAAENAPSRAYGIALMNEHLADIQADLAQGEQVPKSVSRIALAAGGALAIFAVVPAVSAETRPAGLHPAIVHTGVIVALGLGTGLVAHLLGRQGEQRVRREREGWNKVTHILCRLLPPEPGPASVSDEGPVDSADLDEARE